MYIEKKKVRVLHLELSENIGGIEVFLLNLYSVINRDKVKFDFVSCSKKPAFEKELKEIDADIFKISNTKNIIKCLYELNDLLKRGDYDVIHIHKNSAAVILPFLVARKYKNLRVFVHSHNTRPSVGKISYILHKINKKILWTHSDEHFACSRVAGEWMYGNKKDFKVIKNGIIVRNYMFNENDRISLRKELGIPNDAMVIGNIGRFVRQKNQKRLIEIFKDYNNYNENSYLLLVGEGELRENLEKYVNILEIKNVIFTGVRNDIPKIMMAMDAYVMTSLYEGLPIVGVEAQATGLKMVVADTVSKETKIIDDFSWFSLEEKNEEIIKKIGKLDTDKRKKANIRVMESGFDMENTARYLLKKYCEYANN